MTILRSGNTGFGELTPEARLHITHNSSASYPQLLLKEPQNDYVRLSFKTQRPTMSRALLLRQT